MDHEGKTGKRSSSARAGKGGEKGGKAFRHVDVLGTGKNLLQKRSEDGPAVGKGGGGCHP